MTAWCLVYVSVTFTVMRDGTSLKQRGVPHKKAMSHITYPDPATTRIWPGSNDRVRIRYPAKFPTRPTSTYKCNVLSLAHFIVVSLRFVKVH